MESKVFSKNQPDTIKISNQIYLIKFVKELVKKYHKWMQNEELCALVDTEPMTLAQVKEAQEYANDKNSKCK